MIGQADNFTFDVVASGDTRERRTVHCEMCE